MYIILFKLIIKGILFLYLFRAFINHINELYLLEEYAKNLEKDEYVTKGNKNYLKIELINKFNFYINVCQKGILIDKIKYPLLINPKISIIIPIYNGQNFLNYSLRTIQNQSLKEIEIILIDDCSTDNSLNMIKQFMEEDPRIRLIKNLKTRNILYSKSIGALNSKGNYILQLDQDDMFIREDLFDIIYNESQKSNYDLVQFREIIKNDTYFERRTRVNSGILHWIYHKNNFSMQMPELKNSLFNNKNNYLLWGLLIRAKIYKKAIYKIWEFLLNYKLVFNEDYAATTMIILFSQSYKYLNIFGLLHFIHQQQISYNYAKNKYYHLSNIFFPSYLFNYHVKNNPEDIHLIFNYLTFVNIKYLNSSSILYPEFFRFIIRTLLYNNYLVESNKTAILKLFNIGKNQSRILSSYEYFMNISEFSPILQFHNSIINKTSKYQKILEKIINQMKLNNISKRKKQFDFIFVNKSNFLLDINNLIILKKNKQTKIENHSYYKISIIIYCKELKFLEQTLISIIKQKDFFSFEIIIVYDNIQVLNLNENFTYNNIHIINNLKERGIMHSFSVGALSSKGKYILNFQSGYTFAREDILLCLYNNAANKKVDILEFNLLINKDEKINDLSLDLYKCHHFNSTLNTSILKYNKNYKDVDQEKELLINKLIRADIYRYVIDNYKLIKYDEIIYNYYDDILVFLLSDKKYIFQHIDIFGIIKNIKYENLLRLKQISNDNEQKIFDSIFYINFLFNYTANQYEDKKYVYEEFLNKLSLIYNKSVLKTKDSINLYKKILNCNYIKLDEKKELEFFYNSLNS